MNNRYEIPATPVQDLRQIQANKNQAQQAVFQKIESLTIAIYSNAISRNICYLEGVWDESAGSLIADASMDAALLLANKMWGVEAKRASKIKEEKAACQSANSEESSTKQSGSSVDDSQSSASGQ